MAPRRRSRLAPGDPFEKSIETWLRQLGEATTAVATVTAYRRDLLGVGRRIPVPRGAEVLQLRHLTKRSLRAAFASWADDHSVSSVRRAHSAWSQFFAFLVAEDVVEGSPMAAVEKPPPPERLPRAIRDPEVVERLLATAAEPDRRGRDPWPERDLALVATLFVTGIRAEEAVSLDLGSLERTPQCRRLMVEGKKGAVRAVPVDPSLDEVLCGYLATRAARSRTSAGDDPATPLFVDVTGRRLSADQVRYLIKRLYTRAGLGGRLPPGALVHALRQTFAVSAALAGTDIVELQGLMGHSSLETTRRYFDLPVGDLRQGTHPNPSQLALRAYLQGRGSADPHRRPDVAERSGSVS